MSPGTRRTELLIAGMRGNHCREQISASLESVAGVKGVDVSLFRARATIFHDRSCEAADLIRCVRGAGYGASLTGDRGNVGASGQSDAGLSVETTTRQEESHGHHDN